MKEIKLSQQGKHKGKYIAFIDDQDFENISRVKWCISNGYAKNERFGFMHRYIMHTPSNMQTDHINGNTLDNRKINLRNVTPSQNQMNKKSSGKIQYIGVALYKYGAKKYKIPMYIVKIKHQHKYIHLGIYDNTIKAAEVYNNAALKYHGEYARLNIIPKIQ